MAIAGGGVGGLATAFYMLKSGFDVTVFEKTSAFARFGGPIQFASNALSVLKAMDDKLFDRVLANFTFTGTRTCGIKDGLRADGTFSMSKDSLAYLWDSSKPADWCVAWLYMCVCAVFVCVCVCVGGGSSSPPLPRLNPTTNLPRFVRFPLKECADLFGLPYTGVIDRPDLQETFLEECRRFSPDFIHNGRPVTTYAEQPGGGVKLGFADGSTSDEVGGLMTGRGLGVGLVAGRG